MESDMIALMPASTGTLASRIQFEQYTHREGIVMDFASYRVILDGETIGVLHLTDATTFQNAYYVGKDPLDVSREIKKEAHRVRPRSEANFSRLDTLRRKKKELAD